MKYIISRRGIFLFKPSEDLHRHPCFTKCSLEVSPIGKPLEVPLRLNKGTNITQALRFLRKVSGFARVGPKAKWAAAGSRGSAAGCLDSCVFHAASGGEGSAPH